MHRTNHRTKRCVVVALSCAVVVAVMAFPARARTLDDAPEFVGPRQQRAVSEVDAKPPQPSMPSRPENRESTQHLGGLQAGRGDAARDAGEPNSGAGARIEPGMGTARTVLALAGVIAAILLAAAVFRRAARVSGGLMHALGAGGKAPSGLLSVLGRYPVSRGVTLVLLKVDRRVLLLCQTQSRKNGAGMTTLCEINDAEEVASILTKARDEEGESMSRRFEGLLERFGDETDRAVDGVPNGAVSETTKRGNPFASLRARVAGLKGRAA